jgi:hypothetical protein
LVLKITGDEKMYKLLTILLISSTLFIGNSFAHDDHGVISGQKALNIAFKAINKMTFKDLGFEVGKLDSSWKALDKSQFSIISVEATFFIVSAKNTTNDEKIYFKIANNGQILGAKLNSAF